MRYLLTFVAATFVAFQTPFANAGDTEQTCLFSRGCGGGYAQPAPAPVYAPALAEVNRQLADIRAEQRVQTEILRRMSMDGARAEFAPTFPLRPQDIPANAPTFPSRPQDIPANAPTFPSRPQDIPANAPTFPARPQDVQPNPPRFAPIGNTKAKGLLEVAIYRTSERVK